MRRWRRNEDGQLAGAEAVPLGLLVFFVGLLIVANAWAVVDAKMAVAAAAREATRAYVESPAGSDPMARAEAAAREAVRGMGRDPGRVSVRPIDATFRRCAEARFEVTYPVPALTIPLLGGFGHGITVAARHGEVVDPYRSGLDRAAPACGGSAT